MSGKIGKAFVALAVFLGLSLIFRDDFKHSPGEVMGMLAMFGLAAIILLAIATTWGWLRRRWPKS